MTKPKLISSCCYYGLKADGTCNWCGKECEPCTWQATWSDPLWKDLEMDLVDWDKPSRLFSYDSHEVIGRMYRFIKRREANE